MLDWLKQNLTYDELKFLKPTQKPFGKESKPVFVFDLNGNKLHECESILAASKLIGVDYQSIRYSVYNNSIFKKKYIFSFVDKFELPKKKAKPYRGHNDKPCYAYDIEGNFVEKFASITKAAQHFCCQRHSLDSAIKRKSLTRYGLYFSLSDKFQLPAPKFYNRNPLLRVYKR